LSWPAGIATTPEVDQEGGGTRPIEFGRDVAVLDTLIARFAATPPRDLGPRHPIFGPMAGRDWLRWGYLHCDHHLRQFGA
jgi:hypothetical protein